jgi:hypothetical protein
VVVATDLESDADAVSAQVAAATASDKAAAEVGCTEVVVEDCMVAVESVEDQRRNMFYEPFHNHMFALADLNNDIRLNTADVIPCRSTLRGPELNRTLELILNYCTPAVRCFQNKLHENYSFGRRCYHKLDVFYRFDRQLHLFRTLQHHDNLGAHQNTIALDGIRGFREQDDTPRVQERCDIGFPKAWCGIRADREHHGTLVHNRTVVQTCYDIDKLVRRNFRNARMHPNLEAELLLQALVLR